MAVARWESRNVLSWKQGAAAIVLLYALVKVRAYLRSGCHITHVEVKNKRFEEILKSKGRLGGYKAPFWAGGFLQTALFNYFMPAPDLEFERELVTFADGGQASLDWHKSHNGAAEPDDASRRVVCLIFPALGTSCRTKYVRHLCQYFAKNGMECVVLNMRGAAGTPMSSHNLVNLADPSDVDEMAWHIRSKRPGKKLVAVGASMGSNIMTRYLCADEIDRAPPISAAVSVSNPFNLHNLMQTEQQFPFNLSYFRNLFEGRFLQWFKRRLTRFKHLFKDKELVGYDFNEWLAHDNLENFSEFAAQKVYNFPTFEQYLQQASCGNFITSLRVPTLFINATDDPLVPYSLIPHDDIRKSNNASLLLTEAGGHIAFLDRDLTCWFLPTAKAFLETYPHPNPTCS